MSLLTMIPVAAAYLLGSLPFSVWAGRWFFQTDVREHGSGNAGATNAWRVLGWKAGLPILLLDAGKGYAATLLPFLTFFSGPDPDMILWFRVACGLCAALGHIYPVFAGFRGGKAVATGLGVVMGLMPFQGACSLGVFALIFLLSGYVSLGSLAAALSLPFFAATMQKPVGLPLLLFAVLIGIMVVLSHLKNIKRLLRNQESRVSLFRKRSGRGT